MGWQDAPLADPTSPVKAPGDKAPVTAKSWRDAPLAEGRAGVRSESGRRFFSREKDFPSVGFLDRSVLSAMDNKEEATTYFERKYGKGSVSSDKKGLIVTIGGKKFRAGTDIVSDIVSQAPELALGTAGAAAGAAGGPVGAALGAGLGAATGKSIKEGIKAATGLEKKEPKEVVSSVMKEGVAGAVGEGAFRAFKAPISRLTRGPLPHFATDTTPESRAMTERTLAGGARPPPQSTLPAAKKIQRISILADKISGPNKSIDRANIGYLQDRAEGILSKAGVKGPAKDETMSRLMTTNQAAMSFQDTGRLIQNSARLMARPPNAAKGKVGAYLRELSKVGKTPEDAYDYLVTPGQTDRLERFVGIMGQNSVVVEAVRQRALRHLLAGALDRSASGEAVGALEKELSQFTIKQQRILFPKGLADDVKLFANEVQFLFPKIKDPAMAGFTAGGILGKIWYDRFYAQGYYSLMRAALQQPAMIRRLAIGFRGDSAQRIAARNALREMFYFGALEMTRPGEDPHPDAKKEAAK
jgi:hypothetical protein